MIVIRSLVPGGVAQMDGRAMPGDRLVSVNNVKLFNATLDQAVHVLKGTPKGLVSIGILKPLPDFGESTTDEIVSQIVLIPYRIFLFLISIQ